MVDWRGVITVTPQWLILRLLWLTGETAKWDISLLLTGETAKWDISLLLTGETAKWDISLSNN